MAAKCSCTPQQKVKCATFWAKLCHFLFNCGGAEARCAVFDGQAGLVWNALLFPLVLTIGFYRAYARSFLTITFGRCFRSVCCVCCNKNPACAKMCCQDHFVDVTFPQQDAMGSTAGAWRRIDALAKHDKSVVETFDGAKPKAEMVLFDGDIEPCDLLQGAVGDCWLIAALAAAAEHPASIRSRFLTLERNFRGRYVVELHYKGEWRKIVVDDFVPVHDNGESGATSIYASANGNEMWTLLFEKAFAKMFTKYGDPSGRTSASGYAALDGGHEMWVFQALTGHKGGTFAVDSDACDKAIAAGEEGEHPFDRICRLASQAALMGTNWGHGASREEQRDNGLVLGHAYSVLDGRRCVLGGVAGCDANVADVADEDNEVLLVKLRNPWGSHEWNGRWSDKSSEWTRYPHVSKMVGFTAEDDGTFFMEWHDFSRLANGVQYCERDAGIRDLVLDIHEGECSFIYRYISRESCSQFDSLPLTSLTKTDASCTRAVGSASTSAARRAVFCGDSSSTTLCARVRRRCALRVCVCLRCAYAVPTQRLRSSGAAAATAAVAAAAATAAESPPRHPSAHGSNHAVVSHSPSTNHGRTTPSLLARPLPTFQRVHCQVLPEARVLLGCRESSALARNLPQRRRRARMLWTLRSPPLLQHRCRV